MRDGACAHRHRAAAPGDPAGADPSVLSLAAAWPGAVATAVGIGLARFAYVPLFPALVLAGWVEGGGASLVAAANLAGYLAGALAGRRLARRLGVPRALDAAMLAAALAFAACALPAGLAWLILWRALAGAAGGVLMALAGPAVQAVTPPERRGAASGVVIAGVGFGICAGALAVPALLGLGVPAAWAGLALLTLGLHALARPHWPDPPAGESAAEPPPPARGLLLAYGLSAAGMVPPMVWLADLAVRGHGAALASGAAVWALFGLGAILGTLAGGRAADRLGAERALALWLGVQAAALAAALLPVAAGPWLAAPLSGFAGVGVSAVALAVARERAGDWARDRAQGAAQRAGAAAGALWARATAIYAAAQAGAAFALAALFEASGEAHAAVFSAGLAVSLAACWVTRRTTLRERRT